MTSMPVSFHRVQARPNRIIAIDRDILARDRFWIILTDEAIRLFTSALRAFIFCAFVLLWNDLYPEDVQIDFLLFRKLQTSFVKPQELYNLHSKFSEPSFYCPIDAAVPQISEGAACL